MERDLLGTLAFGLRIRNERNAVDESFEVFLSRHQLGKLDSDTRRVGGGL